MPAGVTLRLGTRGSLLALAQSRLIAAELQSRHPGLNVEMTAIKTSGDKIADKPLYDVGGKGLFVKELEQALLGGDIDFAVHSFKDVPVTMPLVEQGNLLIAATPKRHDARDLLIWPAAGIKGVGPLYSLPRGARVGTGSLRRRCQLLAVRADLRIEPIRGNIDTRLKKLRAGECDALVLAAAGIERAGLFEDWMHRLDPEQILPAPGQGALALQCRRDDKKTAELLQALDDEETRVCVAAERGIVEVLQGDCHSPIAAFGEMIDGKLRLRAAVGNRDGQPPVLFAAGDSVAQVSADLLARGAAEMLRPSH